jgi:hypothetical protein
MEPRASPETSCAWDFALVRFHAPGQGEIAPRAARPRASISDVGGFQVRGAVKKKKKQAKACWPSKPTASAQLQQLSSGTAVIGTRSRAGSVGASEMPTNELARDEGEEAVDLLSTSRISGRGLDGLSAAAGSSLETENARQRRLVVGQAQAQVS